MARLACAVFSGYPHHVTQRGNGRAQTFFEDADYAAYRDLLAAHCAAAGVSVWAWVLMPNHVHLLLEPSDPDGLPRACASASPLCRSDPFAAETYGPFLAGSVRLCRDGRCACRCCRRVRAAEPGTRVSGWLSEGLAMVEHPRASRHARRFDRSRAGHLTLPGSRRPARCRRGRRTGDTFAPRGNDRAADRRCDLPAAAQTGKRAHAGAAATRAKAARIGSLMHCDRNSLSP